MLEIITEAIVLDKEASSEYDSRIFLYTKELGKVAANATSARKITSKLAPHLEPLNRINARLVSRRNDYDGRFRLADALLISSAGECEKNHERLKMVLRSFDFINRIIPEGAPDAELWDFLRGILTGEMDCGIKDTLKFLGFDTDFAHCSLCNKTKPEFFYFKNHFFICRRCVFASQISDKDYVKI
jgi:DNA repair protein RecO